MKLVSHFTNFLRTEVNLNQTRIDDLESSVEAIKDFIRGSDYQPRIWKYIEQGSWAHDTIIKPRSGGEFDADLLVIVEPVEGWQPADYVDKLYGVFRSSGLYKDKCAVWEYCTTVTYAGSRKIDIAPCVRGRVTPGQLEVCNKADASFEVTEPILYTEWIKDKNSLSGNNSFRKVTRLVKFLRDIGEDFRCSSVLLTTLIGERIGWSDNGASEFADVPSTLKTIISRLDDWFQQRPDKPRVENPHNCDEDFAAYLSQEEYDDLRSAINSLRERVQKAFETKGIYASIEAWREVFGKSFAKGVTVVSSTAILEDADTDAEETDEAVVLADVVKTDAAHDNRIVELVQRAGRWIWKPSLDRPKHMSRPIWPRADVVSDSIQVSATWRPTQHSAEGRQIADFEQLPAKGGVWFDVALPDGAPVPPGHFVRYRITNTGAVAISMRKGRGGFEAPQEGTRRWETLEYRGIHLAEAFVIRNADSRLVAQSLPFHVVIE